MAWLYRIRYSGGDPPVNARLPAIFTSADAAEHGVTRRVLQRMLRDGLIERISHPPRSVHPRGTTALPRIRPFGGSHRPQAANRRARLPRRTRPIRSGHCHRGIGHRRATALEASPADCLLVTSSPADIKAAQEAGTTPIGYPRASNDAAHLVDAGATTFVYSMAVLALSLRSSAH